MGIDWRNSKAHLELLSKFYRYTCLNEHVARYPWNDVLSESLEDAINRFINEGIAKAADLNDLLSRKFKTIELQKMLTSRGLSISGPKASMIKRLLRADPEGMLNAVSGMRGYKLTQLGQEIVIN